MAYQIIPESENSGSEENNDGATDTVEWDKGRKDSYSSLGM